MRWPWNPSVSERGDRDETPLPHSWGRRHWKMLTSAAVVVVLVAGGIGVWIWKPWNHCGPGLTFNGTVCVGLALTGSGFRGNDPLSGLEKKISENNSAIHGPGFVSIVYLDDLAPNQQSDSVNISDLRHRIEGLIAAQREANFGGLAYGTTPKIKLLLANYGANAGNEQQAVNGISQAQADQHIAAVTGIGQSLVNTRKAVADLSRDNIVTVGSITSADDMNTDPRTRQPIRNFFRVDSTNMDEAAVGAAYMAQHHYRRILLVQDQNPKDDYVGNLGADVKYQAQKKHLSVAQVDYESTNEPLYGTNRSSYMTNLFQDKINDVCQNKPDLIYFAGRGVDLRSFLKALAGTSSCKGYQPKHIDVLSGDDVVSMGKGPIDKWGNTEFNVYYTAVATGNEWAADQADTNDSLDYRHFAADFHESGFAGGDLTDGHAIMTYDAVLTAADAARHDKEIVQSPGKFNPGNVRSFVSGFDCAYPAPGAGGRIAFPAAKSVDQGDPSDKPVPIMRVQQNGRPVPVPQALEWSVGSSFDSGCGKYSS